ncbi:C10 family peptidase [Spirosoma linguale]|uniref:Peptidase C10 streptopain n=1 Tax=Spirosoma linguale (strain ATCC 33905 / DSM 74 / LMG 10896 / Claus 1) TaxID=504472 RepID=D2QDN0_SPILD|nr:peptidase C10 streptopain [Spirosoma linguale DSM 74]
MNVNYFTLTRLLSFLIIFGVASCQKSGLLEPSDPQINSNIVSIEQANKVASTAPQIVNPKNANSQARIGSSKKTQETFTKYDEYKNPLLYIITYKEGGFIIVSGDNRITPVLAYSDNNSFINKTDNMPSGLKDWFSSVEQVIKRIRKDNQEQDKTVKRVWDKFIQQSANGRLITVEGDCNTDPSMKVYFEFGPFVTTTWDQADGYNDALSYSSCTTTANGKVLTGCVATAVAQIMKYHAYPTSYSWSSMPNNYGTNATAVLMRDLGTSANLNASYGCNSTSAPMSNIPTTFSHFGYSTPSLSSYNYFTVKYELQNYSRPVILKGQSNSDAHAWVCDGVRHWDYYSCQPDPNTPGEKIAVYTGYDAGLHMNWGWGNSYNGWYSANNFNPSGYAFNSYREMVTGITH